MSEKQKALRLFDLKWAPLWLALNFTLAMYIIWLRPAPLAWMGLAALIGATRLGSECISLRAERVFSCVFDCSAIFFAIALVPSLNASSQNNEAGLYFVQIILLERTVFQLGRTLFKSALLARLRFEAAPS